jgi:hypothetical protein
VGHSNAVHRVSFFIDDAHHDTMPMFELVAPHGRRWLDRYLRSYERCKTLVLDSERGGLAVQPLDLEAAVCIRLAAPKYAGVIFTLGESPDRGSREWLAVWPRYLPLDGTGRHVYEQPVHP